MVETGIRHLANLKKKVKKMIGRRGYREELDAFSPQQEQEHSETTDKIREMFTQTLLDTRIEQAIPVLNKLEARDSVMKEIQEFSSWADETTQLDLGEGFDPDSWEGEMEWEYAGDDGEPGYGGVRYTVVVDHEQNRAFVDPKSLQGWCHGDGNNKLTDEWCTQMVQPGGELHDEALQAAQEDVDAEWAERDVDVPMEDKEYECPTCRGAGEYRDEEHKKHDCPDCDGEGKYVDVDDLEEDNEKNYRQPGFNNPRKYTDDLGIMGKKDKMKEGKMKDLAMDLNDLSDKEFEEKYGMKKTDWDEVKTPGLRQDPSKPAYISKNLKDKKPKDWAQAISADESVVYEAHEKLEKLVGQRVYVKDKGQTGTVAQVSNTHSNALVVDMDNGQTTVTHFTDLTSEDDKPTAVKRYLDMLKAIFDLHGKGPTPKDGLPAKSWDTLGEEELSDIKRLSGLK